MHAEPLKPALSEWAVTKMVPRLRCCISKYLQVSKYQSRRHLTLMQQQNKLLVPYSYCMARGQPRSADTAPFCLFSQVLGMHCVIAAEWRSVFCRLFLAVHDLWRITGWKRQDQP